MSQLTKEQIESFELTPGGEQAYMEAYSKYAAAALTGLLASNSEFTEPMHRSQSGPMIERAVDRAAAVADEMMNIHEAMLDVLRDAESQDVDRGTPQ